MAIGKQWSPHYNIIAEVTDIFNHRSSPFGYDAASPFRVNQMVTYAFKKRGFKLDAGLQFNGNLENSAGGDNSDANNTDYVDSGSFGIGYDFGSVYVGASYLDQQLDETDEERTFIAIGASWKVSDTIYLATTYQDIERSARFASNDEDFDQSSLDIVASVSLNERYTFKTSYFDWDSDGHSDGSYDGYNLTLENKLNDSVKVFVEWLSRDYEGADKNDSLSVGVRYDFDYKL